MYIWGASHSYLFDTSFILLERYILSFFWRRDKTATRRTFVVALRSATAAILLFSLSYISGRQWNLLFSLVQTDQSIHSLSIFDGSMSKSQILIFSWGQAPVASVRIWARSLWRAVISPDSICTLNDRNYSFGFPVQISKLIPPVTRMNSWNDMEASLSSNDVAILSKVARPQTIPIGIEPIVNFTWY